MPSEIVRGGLFLTPAPSCFKHLCGAFHTPCVLPTRCCSSLHPLCLDCSPIVCFTYSEAHSGVEPFLVTPGWNYHSKFSYSTMPCLSNIACAFWAGVLLVPLSPLISTSSSRSPRQNLVDTQRMCAEGRETAHSLLCSALRYSWKQGSVFLSLGFLSCRVSGVGFSENKKVFGRLSGPTACDSCPLLEDRVHQSLETKMIFD